MSKTTHFGYKTVTEEEKAGRVAGVFTSVADKYDVRGNIRFGVEVAQAAFDDETKIWRLTLGSGETLTARVLVSGQGALSIPALPKIYGLETFSGDAFHSGSFGPYRPSTRRLNAQCRVRGTYTQQPAARR